MKPRWACTQTERMDTFNLSMLACLFGCDALYELGYVVVDNDGTIKRGIRRSLKLESKLSAILDRRCPCFTDESSQYFEWHRLHQANLP